MLNKWDINFIFEIEINVSSSKKGFPAHNANVEFANSGTGIFTTL